MGTPLNLGKKQLLPCVIINFGVWLSHLRFQFWQVQAGPFGARTGVLSNVSSDEYDDLEHVTLLQGRCPLEKNLSASRIPGGSPVRD